MIPLKHWMDSNVCGLQSPRFLWSSPGASPGSAPPHRAPPPPPAWTADTAAVSAPRTRTPWGSPQAPRARYVTRDTWQDMWQWWQDLIIHVMYISWLSLRVTVTETALPNLILTPATCRISTLVKLNSEFEMGLEWARKWEAEFIYWSQKLPTFTQEGRGPSPTSPGCKCRRCSLLHIDECDPKEVSSLFKFLRKRKVNCPELSENQWEISGQCSARCGSGGPYPVFWHYLRLAWYRGQIECSDDVKWHKACWPGVAVGVLCELFAQVIK